MYIGYNTFYGYLHSQVGVGHVPWAWPINAQLGITPSNPPKWARQDHFQPFLTVVEMYFNAHWLSHF